MKRVVLFACLLATVGHGADWPTLHNDNQRSGYTDEVVRGPYERKWYRDFHDEMIATRVEAIVVGGRCFVGTFAGTVYALDVATGRTLWSFKAAGPIGASPCWRAGKLYFGADEGYATGNLYCLDAADGSLVWKYDAGAGIWVSPACDGVNVYFGDRAGVFHAISADEGRSQWTIRTDGMILTPASITADGRRIVFGSDDMYVRCCDTRGGLLWKSGKLSGLSMRDHGPTIWRGLAIVRTNPADGFHTVMGRNGDLLKETQLAIPRTDEDEVLLDKWNDLLMAPTEKRRAAEQEAVVEYLQREPRDKCFYALGIEDGVEQWTAPVFYTGGLHNPPTAPTFNPESGRLYTFCRSALTYYVRGVRRYNCMGRIDRTTGRFDFYWPSSKAHENWYPFAMIGDETQSLSMMGDELICTHQGTLASLNVETLKVTTIWAGRDTYGGIFGPAAVPGGFDGARKMAAQGYLTGMPNEWHGPDRSILSVAENRLFWVTGSQVVCIAGPDVPATDSGGTKPPAPFKSRLPACVAGGNVASEGGGTAGGDIEKMEITSRQLEPFIAAPAMTSAKGDDRPAARKLRETLEAEIGEFIEGYPWAPFIVELGISGELRCFSRTAETMRILAQAAPHVSDATRQAVVGKLDEMFAEQMPLSRPVFADSGSRREPFESGVGMEDFAAKGDRYGGGIEDLYAVWAYAHYCDRWDAVLGQIDRIGLISEDFAGRGFSFSHEGTNDEARHLNAQIAGVIGAIRLMDRAGRSETAGKLRSLLAAMVTERVHHERADSRLIRPSRAASKGLHYAEVPRYGALTPEVTAILSRFAGEQLGTNLNDLMRGLPLWYQAYGERMIGGENYISPPGLSQGLFMAAADGEVLDAEQLTAKLDQPWCRADLNYIDKLGATLRSLGRVGRR